MGSRFFALVGLAAVVLVSSCSPPGFRSPAAVPVPPTPPASTAPLPTGYATVAPIYPILITDFVTGTLTIQAPSPFPTPTAATVSPAQNYGSANTPGPVSTTVANLVVPNPTLVPTTTGTPLPIFNTQRASTNLTFNIQESISNATGLSCNYFDSLTQEFQTISGCPSAQQISIPAGNLVSQSEFTFNIVAAANPTSVTISSTPVPLPSITLMKLTNINQGGDDLIFSPPSFYFYKPKNQLLFGANIPNISPSHSPTPYPVQLFGTDGNNLIQYSNISLADPAPTPSSNAITFLTDSDDSDSNVFFQIPIPASSSELLYSFDGTSVRSFPNIAAESVFRSPESVISQGVMMAGSSTDGVNYFPYLITSSTIELLSSKQGLGLGGNMDFASFGGRFYFTAFVQGSTTASKLFSYASGDSSFLQISNTAGTANNDSPSNLKSISYPDSAISYLYFSSFADNTGINDKLYATTDGTTIQQISNTGSDGQPDGIAALTPCGQYLCFAATDSSGIYRFYLANQTEVLQMSNSYQGTTVLGDYNFDFGGLPVVGLDKEHIFYVGYNSSGALKVFEYFLDSNTFSQISETSTSDGVGDIAHSTASTGPLTVLGDSVYFVGYNSPAQTTQKLYSYNTTTNTVVQIGDTNPGGDDSPSNLFPDASGNYLYFVANKKGSGRKLYRTNGTEVFQISEINAGSDFGLNVTFSQFCKSGTGMLTFFNALDSNANQKLYLLTDPADTFCH